MVQMPVPGGSARRHARQGRTLNSQLHALWRALGRLRSLRTAAGLLVSIGLLFAELLAKKLAPGQTNIVEVAGVVSVVGPVLGFYIVLLGVNAQYMDHIRGVAKTLGADALVAQSLPKGIREALRAGLEQYQHSLRVSAFPLRTDVTTTITAAEMAPMGAKVEGQGSPSDSSGGAATSQSSAITGATFLTFIVDETFTFVLPGRVDQPWAYLPTLLVTSGDLLKDPDTVKALAQSQVQVVLPITSDWTANMHAADWQWARSFEYLRTPNGDGERLPVTLTHQGTKVADGRNEIYYVRVPDDRRLVRLARAGVDVGRIRPQLDTASERLLQVYEPECAKVRSSPEPNVSLLCNTKWHYCLPVKIQDRPELPPRTSYFGYIPTPQTITDITFEIAAELRRTIVFDYELMNVPYTNFNKRKPKDASTTDLGISYTWQPACLFLPGHGYIFFWKVRSQ